MAEGYKNFANGAVLGETDLDDYLMSQTVMRFASAAARDSALAAVLVEGLQAYLKDSDTVTVYNGTAWDYGYSIGAWSTYTPTMFQQDGTGQTLTIGKARYTRVGRSVLGSNILLVTNAGSATNGENVIVSMPVAPQDITSSSEIVGTGYIIDVSASIKYPVNVIAGSTSFRFERIDTNATNFWGIDPSISIAAGDTVSFSYNYEAGA